MLSTESTELKKKRWRSWVNRSVELYTKWDLLPCAKCWKEKSIELFYITKWRYFSYCTECSSWKNKNPKARLRTDVDGRECTRCWVYKTRDEFPKNSYSKSWHRAMCSICWRIASQENNIRYLERKANWTTKTCWTKVEVPKDRPIQWDDTCCKEVLDIIAKIWLLPPRQEEYE